MRRIVAVILFVLAGVLVLAACGGTREPRLAWQDDARPGPVPWLVLSGRPPKFLARGLRGSFSPDGSRLSYMTDHGGIVVLDLRDGRKRVVDRNSGLEPAWSPDGRRLAWRRTVGNFSEVTYIEVRSLVDGSVRRFAHPGELEVGGWLNDRRLVLGDADTPVVLDTSTVRMHTSRARCFHAKPAPDGRHFTCMTLPGYRIAVGDIGSSHLRVLPTPRRILANYPAWSPDGGLIAFENQNERSDYGIYVIRSDGTHLRRVANGFLLYPFWRR